MYQIMPISHLYIIKIKTIFQISVIWIWETFENPDPPFVSKLPLAKVVQGKGIQKSLVPSLFRYGQPFWVYCWFFISHRRSAQIADMVGGWMGGWFFQEIMTLRDAVQKKSYRVTLSLKPTFFKFWKPAYIILARFLKWYYLWIHISGK